MLTKLKNIFSKEVKEKSGEVHVNKETSISQEIKNEDEKIAMAVKSTESLNSNDKAAVNKEPQSAEEDIKADKDKPEPSLEEVKEEVIKILKTCYDPEIPVDVWELGLIYDIKIATNRDVLIVMTLTSPSCPVAGILPGEIEQKVKEHPMVNDCKVQLTFEPPWSQKNMSEVAKLELGFL